MPTVGYRTRIYNAFLAESDCGWRKHTILGGKRKRDYGTRRGSWGTEVPGNLSAQTTVDVCYSADRKIDDAHVHFSAADIKFDISCPSLHTPLDILTVTHPNAFKFATREKTRKRVSLKSQANMLYI